VEGASPLTLVHDSADHPFQIAENLLGGNPHGAEANLLQEAVSACIARGLIASIVGLSINLHR